MKKLTLIIIIFFASYSSYSQQKKFVEIKAAMEEKFRNEARLDNEAEKEEDDDRAKYKRWEWWAERHLDEQGYIVDDINKSFLVYEQNKADTSFLTGRNLSVGGGWTEMSHAPYGTTAKQMGKGRIDCIVEVPGTPNVVVGTSGGGMWLGVRPNVFLPFLWSPFTDGLARLSITDICINPNNVNEVYIATGSGDNSDLARATGYTSTSSTSRSMGILKSTDGGLNWNRTSLFFENSDETAIYRMIMDPVDPQIMYAATDAGIFRTTNGWQTNQNILESVVTDIKLKPNNRQVIFLSRFTGLPDPNNINSIVSRMNADGTGLTNIFTFPSPVVRVVLGVTPANGEYLYLLGGVNNTGFRGLYKCINSGAPTPSFNLQSSSPDILNYNTSGSGKPNGQVFYDIVIAVHPQNAERIFAGGLNLWESTNGGSTWTVRSDWTSAEDDDAYCHSDFHQLKFNSQGNLYNCNDGGLFTLNLTSNKWTYNSIGVNNTQYFRISITNQTSGVFYNGRLVLGGTQDNGTVVWRSSGLTKSIGGDGMDNAMASDDGLYQVATNQNGKLLISKDGGLSFDAPSDTTLENGSGQWVTPIVQHCSVPVLIYAGYKNIYFSDDDIDDWTGVINTNFTSPVIAMCQGDYTTAGQPGTNVIYCATDINTTSGAPANYHLYRVENNLASTKTDLGPFSNIITSVKCDPVNARNVYVTLGGFGNNNKVYFSNNRGQNWTNISGPLNGNGSFPDLPANCIALKDGGSDGIYVGTDIGVYFKPNPNAGSKWTLFSNGLPNVPVTDLEIDPVTNEIFAGTYGRGLWKSDLHESCLSVVNVSGNTTGVTYYEAASTINSSSTTSGGYGNKITLNAGEEINLTDGFEVKEGSAMWSYIQGCNDPRNGPLFDKTSKAKKAGKPLGKKAKGRKKNYSSKKNQ